MPPLVCGGEFDGVVVEEDGFVLGRDWIDAVPGALLCRPLREWGILPGLGGLIPLPGFPFRRRTLVDVVREHRLTYFRRWTVAGHRFQKAASYFNAFILHENE